MNSQFVLLVYIAQIDFTNTNSSQIVFQIQYMTCWDTTLFLNIQDFHYSVIKIKDLFICKEIVNENLGYERPNISFN